MKVEYINPFLKATKNVIETMAQTKVKHAKPQLKTDAKTSGEVTGVIGMTCATLTGAMVLSFSESCILHIVAAMLMEPIRERVDADVVDAVGELTNMICGGAKAELSKLDLKFELATPTMVVGKDVEISMFSKTPTIVIPFTTEHGNFVVEANLREKN
ncbi:MAG: chemotaxis protein CheX [Deltaproteobacteria bacterium CG23_combo_of_CG06-09_8_20_14_all_60_8]|nr:MAG: chemotaxis protein CheX [Desulfobacterales bacterium CG2_30_60_27]PIP43284.1 MAG: chemotaxis protein CheX [Deltaproteobacteria bacterium CG23_combo_of_CG06-09_8_20_14_all_60_8]